VHLAEHIGVGLASGAAVIAFGAEAAVARAARRAFDARHDATGWAITLPLGGPVAVRVVVGAAAAAAERRRRALVARRVAAIAILLHACLDACVTWHEPREIRAPGRRAVRRLRIRSA
jgi:hypothetical protein